MQITTTRKLSIPKQLTENDFDWGTAKKQHFMPACAGDCRPFVPHEFGVGEMAGRYSGIGMQ